MADAKGTVFILRRSVSLSQNLRDIFAVNNLFKEINSLTNGKGFIENSSLSVKKKKISFIKT